MKRYGKVVFSEVVERQRGGASQSLSSCCWGVMGETALSWVGAEEHD